MAAARKQGRTTERAAQSPLTPKDVLVLLNQFRSEEKTQRIPVGYKNAGAWAKEWGCSWNTAARRLREALDRGLVKAERLNGMRYYRVNDM